MIRRQTGTGGRTAALTVEFALCFPIVILFMFAIFEYGRFLMTRQLLDNAAREGARLAAADPGFNFDHTTLTATQHTLTTSDIQNTVFDYLAGQPLSNASGQPLTATDISVYRADPVTGLPMTDWKGSAWTTASFGESIAIKITVLYTPIIPRFPFLVNPDPVSFICIMRSEANN
jgi:Flp pilus assembly protein TadG